MPENGVSKPAHAPEETEVQRDQPVLCANNCGFYGRPQQRNLCSKCFKDALKAENTQEEAEQQQQQQQQTLAASTALSTEVASPSSSEPAQKKSEKVDLDSSASTPAAATASSTDASASAAADDEKSEETTPAKKVKKNRCGMCRKKLRLAQQFSCRCEQNFCSSHRDPDAHECTFDFRTFSQEQLTKANPVVVADKIKKI